MQLRTSLYILGLSATIGATTQIVQVEWSNTTYGPDGPWYAASVYLGFNGSTGQRLDLYPGGNGLTEVFLPGYCQNSAVPAGQCGADQSGLYNPNASRTAIPYFNQSYHVSETIDLTLVEVLDGGDIYYDNLYFTNNQSFNSTTGLPDVYAKNNLLIGLTGAQDHYPTGIITTPEVGILDLGGLDDGGFPNSTVVTSAFYETGVTASASFGLHIGSVSMNIPPSMNYGGYDAARIVGQVLTSTGPTISNHFDTFEVQLMDIGLNTAQGASPFPPSSQNGILAQGNSSLSGGIPVPLQAQTPWLGLPQSTCKALAQYLPVSYDATLGLYLWNTNDIRYQQIVSSPSYVSFTLQSDSGNDQISIKVPFSLLNLTLEPPTLVLNPTPYFPCAPTQSGWYLGRAFLQAAFMGMNWKPKNPPGSFWVAQAPGPNVPAQNLTTIHNNDLILPSTDVDWQSTWAGHWTPLNESEVGSTGSQQPQSGESRSSGLSSGAKAALGICLGLIIPIILGLIGAVFYIRHRKRKQREAAAAAAAAESQTKSESSAGYQMNKAELAAWEASKQNEKQRHQLDGNDARAEMTGDGQRVELDDALGGAANPAEALYDTQVHEAPEIREYFKGMPVRVAGDPAERVEIE